MRYKKYFVFALFIFTLLACDLTSSIIPNNSDESSDATDEDMSVQEQVEATTSALQTATALIQQAVEEALTAIAPVDTNTPEFTSTPVPTETPVATNTPTPTPTIKATVAPVVSYQTSTGDCKNETGNVEFRNNSGSTATVELVMTKKGRTCTYFIFLAPVGSSWFWVEPAVYEITMKSCHGTSTVTGNLNSGWWFRFKAC